MRKDNIFLAVAIENAVIYACFTVIAVLFQKWWIVLFACLFTKSVTFERR